VPDWANNETIQERFSDIKDDMADDLTLTTILVLTDDGWKHVEAGEH